MKIENEKLQETIRNIETSHVDETSHPSSSSHIENLTFQNAETIETVNRKISHMFDDEQIISSTFGMVAGSSLASEMDNTSKDDVSFRII